MGVSELCYKIEKIPDLSLNKYASLDGSGVDGVLEKHLAFLRQWNRKGALSGTSVHLFYYYDGQNEQGSYAVGNKGSKLKILFLIRGEERKMSNAAQLVSASPLSEYFKFTPCTFDDFLHECRIEKMTFSVCSTLVKKEVFVRSSIESAAENGGYYTVPQWETNEDARLYNMCKLMEALDKQALYRIDLYPAEKSDALRNALRKPSAILRERQYSKSGGLAQRDYEAENVLKSYDDLLSSIDESPHFIANIFAFANSAENSAVIVDAAGAEALKKGSYNIGTFSGTFNMHSFLNEENEPENYEAIRGKITMHKGAQGYVICNEDSSAYKLNYLPTLFTLEDAAPFFRLPALYDGEVIQKPKETAPKIIPENEGLFLGTDGNGYDVYFPLENVAKHAFLAGVPGSGKTKTMLHLTSRLWKEHETAFLVLEPAKQEYRALVNQKGMEGAYLFSPNADMSFPLHINPFEFPKGLMLAEHIRRLCAVFEGAFPLENPMPFLLDQAIESVYRQLGWTPETVNTDDTKLKFPTMSMLYKRLEDELKVTTYSEEIRGNLESALKVRIGSLLRREMGDVFDVPSSTLPPEKWLEVPAIIELESMGTGPANFLTLMLCTLIREVLKVNPHSKKKYARHIIFIEEAHNLIGPEAEEVSGADANPKQAATSFVVKMLAEVRALKEGIVIADQLPTVMAQEVIKNTGLKVGLRITSEDDRMLLGSTMAANPLQLEAMATFSPGQALISYEGLMKPFTMRMHEWCGRWGLKQCSDENFDINWCKENCDYYKNGDCIPIRDERELVTASKSDAELVEAMRSRETYKETCTRSFIIVSMRFIREYTALDEKVNRLIRQMKKANEKMLEIKKIDDEIESMTEKLLFSADPRESESLNNELMLASSRESKLRREFEENVLPHKKVEEVDAAIKDCILFARKIQDKKKHWKYLGITEIEAAEQDSSMPDTETAKTARAIIDMQKTAVVLAQQLFAVSSRHLPDAKNMKDGIIRAADIFRAKNVLS